MDREEGVGGGGGGVGRDGERERRAKGSDERDGEVIMIWLLPSRVKKMTERQWRREVKMSHLPVPLSLHSSLLTFSPLLLPRFPPHTTNLLTSSHFLPTAPLLFHRHPPVPRPRLPVWYASICHQICCVIKKQITSSSSPSSLLHSPVTFFFSPLLLLCHHHLHHPPPASLSPSLSSLDSGRTGISLCGVPPPFLDLILPFPRSPCAVAATFRLVLWPLKKTADQILLLIPIIDDREGGMKGRKRRSDGVGWDRQWGEVRRKSWWRRGGKQQGWSGERKQAEEVSQHTTNTFPQMRSTTGEERQQANHTSTWIWNYFPSLEFIPKPYFFSVSVIVLNFIVPIKLRSDRGLLLT